MELVKMAMVDKLLGMVTDDKKDCPSPATVEAKDVFKKGVDTKLSKFGVETRPNKFCVETKFSKLGVETRPNKLAVDRNPAV